MNVHVRFFTMAALVALAASAAPAAAQSALPPVLDEVPSTAATPVATAAATADTTAKSAPRGPSVASARVASHAVSTPNGAPPVIQNRSSNRNAVALMAVGGAALIVGAVIGEDAGTFIMLGGAVIGLYGLYLFLT